MKDLADVNGKLMDLHKKKQAVEAPQQKTQETQSGNVTNNAIFVGSTSELNKLIDMETLNLRHSTIQDIINSKAWQTVWTHSFENNKLPTCARQCGKWDKPILSQSKDQQHLFLHRC